MLAKGRRVQVGSNKAHRIEVLPETLGTPACATALLPCCRFGDRVVDDRVAGFSSTGAGTIAAAADRSIVAPIRNS